MSDKPLGHGTMLHDDGSIWTTPDENGAIEMVEGPTRPLWPDGPKVGTHTDLENRAGVDSLEDLHRQRRQLLPEYATLKALHGTYGKWEARRKALLDATQIRARMVCQEKNVKITDELVKAMAHSDDQYIAFVDEGIIQATRFIELDIQVSEIEERIRSREISILAYNSEIKLAR